MPYTEIEDYNTSEGLHTLFQYVASVEPMFFPFTLFALFIIASVGSFFAQKEMTGKGNLKASLAVAGWFVTIVAYVMSLIPNLVTTITVVVCLILSVVFTLLLYLDKKK